MSGPPIVPWVVCRNCDRRVFECRCDDAAEVEQSREEAAKAIRQYADDLAANESAENWDKAEFVADARQYADDYVKWLS